MTKEKSKKLSEDEANCNKCGTVKMKHLRTVIHAKCSKCGRNVVKMLGAGNQSNRKKKSDMEDFFE